MGNVNRNTNNEGVLSAISTVTGKAEYLNSTSGALDVDVTINTPPLPTTPVYGQQAVTATAAALPSGALKNGVIVTGLSTNSISVFIGDASVTTSNGAEIQPGAALSAAVADTSDLYVIASTTGASVSWLGS
jgi:hypothetical protein